MRADSLPSRFAYRGEMLASLLRHNVSPEASHLFHHLLTTGQGQVGDEETARLLNMYMYAGACMVEICKRLMQIPKARVCLKQKLCRKIDHYSTECRVHRLGP